MEDWETYHAVRVALAATNSLAKIHAMITSEKKREKKLGIRYAVTCIAKNAVIIKVPICTPEVVPPFLDNSVHLELASYVDKKKVERLYDEMQEKKIENIGLSKVI